MKFPAEYSAPEPPSYSQNCTGATSGHPGLSIELGQARTPQPRISAAVAASITRAMIIPKPRRGGRIASPKSKSEKSIIQCHRFPRSRAVLKGCTARGAEGVEARRLGKGRARRKECSTGRSSRKVQKTRYHHRDFPCGEWALAKPIPVVEFLLNP
jgi:hypothetical protein